MPPLRKPSIAVEKRMLEMLEYASRTSKSATRWHEISYDEDSKEAAKLLEARGVIEVSWARKQYKIKPGQLT